MKTFRELLFEGEHDALKKYLQDVESRLVDGWYRDTELEEKFAEHVPPRVVGFSDRAYFCPATDELEASHLWISARSPVCLEVPNVVPNETDQLTYDEYNRIVKAFHDRFAIEPASQYGVTVTLGPEELRFEVTLPPEVFKKLRLFSGTARRDVRASHPQDRELWREFIVAADETGCELFGAELKRWLVEDEGWPEDVAQELAVEYDEGRSLLSLKQRATA